MTLRDEPSLSLFHMKFPPLENFAGGFSWQISHAKYFSGKQGAQNGHLQRSGISLGPLGTLCMLMFVTGDHLHA